MDPRPPDADRSEGASPPSLPPPGFLLRLASGIGTRPRGPVDSSDVDPAEAVVGSWVDVLERRLREVALRAHAIEVAADELTRFVGARSALACWRPDLGWVALVSAGSGQIEVISQAAAGEALEEESVARLFWGEDEGLRTWVVVEPTLTEASSRPGEKLTPLRRLASMLRPDRADLGTIVIYAVFVGLLSLATPIAVQQLVNSVAFGGLVQPVVVLAVMLMFGLGFAALLSTLQAVVVEFIQRRVFVRMCIDLAERLPRVAPGGFGSRYGPEMVNRFFDVVTLQKTGATLLLVGTAVLLQTVTGLMILSFYHPLMFGFCLVLLLSIAFVIVVLGRGGTDTAIAESSAKYELAAWMEEIVRVPGSFLGRAGRRHAARRADALATYWVDARERHFRIVLRQIVASLGLQVIANASVLAIGGVLVVQGQLTLGQLVASEIIVAAVVAAFARLGKLLESYYDLLAAVEKVGMLLDLPLERSDGRALPPVEGPASVEVRDLEVDDDVPPVSLVIRPGERVGIAGPSGGGKTVLLDSITGLRAQDAGHVLIDGEPIALLHLESLREDVMCLRYLELHGGSIVDNVRVARPTASTAEIESALERVGLMPVIERLPSGTLTRIRPDGHPLSAGQARQLMLARAVVARPRLLAVDEEITRLDPSACEAVRDVLFDPSAPWSLVLASHDPAWLDGCDRVIELPGVAVEAPSRHRRRAAGPSGDASSEPGRDEESAA